MTQRTRVFTGLMILSIVLGGAAGCAPAATQPAIPPTPTLPSGWETHSASADQGQCGYVIDHPAAMDVASQGTYNWLLNSPTAQSSEPVPNFIYISVIPDNFQSSEPGSIYNYDPGETQTLLNMQVGESRSLREDPNTASWFTYTRLPDTALGGQSAQAYQNDQPWEFPPGTREIRYYLKGNGCTYLLGGYLSTVGSGQPGAIDQALFDKVMASFRLAR